MNISAKLIKNNIYKKKNNISPGKKSKTKVGSCRVVLVRYHIKFFKINISTAFYTCITLFFTLMRWTMKRRTCAITSKINRMQRTTILAFIPLLRMKEKIPDVFPVLRGVVLHSSEDWLVISK